MSGRNVLRTRKDDAQDQIAAALIYACHPNYVVLTVNYFTLGIMSAAITLKNPPSTGILKAALRRLLTDPHWQQRIVGIHGIPDDARPYPNVSLDGLEAKGDIDILLVDPLHPEFATAIQVKRIKVKDTTFASGTPNKLNALDELKRQANLQPIWLCEVFSFAMVVVDSRKHNNGEYRFDGLTPALRDTIANSVTPDGLRTRIGMMHYEFVQPIDDVPLTSGTYSGHLLRMPQTAPQPEAITAWVAQVIAKRDAESDKK
jgi:hypothetical protein